MTNVQDDLQQIFDDATYGWNNSNVTKPTIAVLNTRDMQGIGVWLQTGKRVLLIKQAEYRTERLDDFYFENRVWEIPVVLIGSNRTDLEDMYDETRRVINYYNQSPWEENNTYTSATIEKASDNSSDNGMVFIMDLTVILAMLFQVVTVA